ncbi:MAG: type II toxin-antitoxin system HipA family toxin, partial [Candidatus Dadabacteria bacterium]|nr:type II toxin-antitoxin system HipA family toxin [Candidatus Dadabacteria bacterium]
WYKTTFSQFKAWADKADIPWKAIKPQLDDTLSKARYLWPKSLDDLPVDYNQKKQLREHWRLLSTDLRIESAGSTITYS